MAYLSFSSLAQSINNSAGSGLGFFGGSFGASVSVGEFQSTTFITSSDGQTQGPQVGQVKYLNSQSGIIQSQSSGVHIRACPNYLATLNIHFRGDSSVNVQNATLRIYDRQNANSNPSGLTCYCAGVQHVGTSQADALGSGDALWVNTFGSGSILNLCPSPGVSGFYANNQGGWADYDHDWFVLISPSPTSIGAKTQFGLLVQLEYL